MPVMKRATAVLQAAGVDLQVKKGLYGYYLYSPYFRKQRGKCHDTVKEVIVAALQGEQPVEIPDTPPTLPH